jgi:4-hydroxybenzoate polyprenyltransferase
MTGNLPDQIIDLDRMILRSDVLAETLLANIKRRPFAVILLVLRLIFGSRNVADDAVRQLELEPAALLYDDKAVEALKAGKPQSSGFSVKSALPTIWVSAIMAHLSLSPASIEKPGNALESLAATPEKTFGETLRQAFRALRPHQWAKNILVFVPLVLAHRITDPATIRDAFVAFFCFSLTASGIYLLNDLMDLGQDRKHPVKCRRPFASGKLPISAGLLMLPICIIGALALAALLPPMFGMVLAVYVTMNLAYTFYLKRKLLVDVLALASAYTLRIIGGEAAAGIDLSFWLLAFSTFLFLSLALVKRYVELDTVGDVESTDKNRVMGRGYRVGDLDMLSQLGVASGFSAVLVLALYVDGAGRLGLYRTPEFIWLVCPIVLYVIGRIWVLAKRRELPDDPVLFIITDWRSHLMGVIVIAIMLAAKFAQFR